MTGRSKREDPASSLRLTLAIRLLPACLFLIVNAIAFPGLAADAGTVHGVVVDEAGQPIPAALILVLENAAEATSGEDGRFELAGLPAGTYQLRAQLAGYSVDTVDGVRVTVQGVTELNFTLYALPNPVKEIVVTARASILRDQPVSSVSLDRTEIMTLPHFGDDLYRAVTTLPGTSGGDFSARFNVRGGLHNELLVRLDGLELYEPFHLKDFQGSFSILDPEMIGSVDLIPGAFPAEYGDRLTGVLDMTIRRPQQHHTSFGISFSNAWATSSGIFADGKGSWIGSIRRGYLDIVLDFVEEEEDDDQPPDPFYWDALAKINYDLNPSNSLSLSVVWADDKLVFEEDDVDEHTEIETGYDSRYLWFGHQVVVGPRTFVNTILSAGRVGIFRDALSIEPDEGIDLRDDRSLDTYGLRQDWELELSRNQYLRWGLDLRSYEADYDYAVAYQIEDPIDDPRFRPGMGSNTFSDRFQSEQYGMYVTDRLRFGTRVTAELGLRWDRQTLTEESQTSPRFNLVYNVGRTGLLRLGWGRFFQSQRPHELDAQFGETAFNEAQEAEHWTVGFENELWQGHKLRVDAYHRKVDKPIPRYETLFDPFNPVPEAATDLVRLAPEQVTAQGIELFLASPRTQRFNWWLSYAYSTIDDRINGEEVPRSIDQTHALTLSGSWRPNQKWNLTGLWTYHTGWPTTAVSATAVFYPDYSSRIDYTVGPFNQERLSDYHRLDVRISRTTTVGKGQLTFFIDVQNLYDNNNPRGFAIADPEYYFGPGDQVRVEFPQEKWLPMLPSFGISYEF